MALIRCIPELAYDLLRGGDQGILPTTSISNCSFLLVYVVQKPPEAVTVSGRNFQNFPGGAYSQTPGLVLL